ncbi:hypothetical protein BJV78DRAFT_1280979 [Lactifluus subvellereus]|nr:hypothetical protein BJV78DRAFT_1280979 [Lactifluus subvellereus]
MSGFSHDLGIWEFLCGIEFSTTSGFFLMGVRAALFGVRVQEAARVARGRVLQLLAGCGLWCGLSVWTRPRLRHELDERLFGAISFQTGIDLENGRLIDAIIALLNDSRWVSPYLYFSHRGLSMVPNEFSTFAAPVMAGHRGGSVYKELKRVIPTAVAQRSAVLGLLSVLANLMGAIGSGPDILMAVTIIYSYWEIVQREAGRPEMAVLGNCSFFFG